MTYPFSALWAAPPAIGGSGWTRLDVPAAQCRPGAGLFPGRRRGRSRPAVGAADSPVFAAFRTPLSLAVVPAWLTRSRWRALASLSDSRSGLWCWHQHGWRHVNHEIDGKKQEFGPRRPVEEIHGDLSRGRRRLEEIMGDVFFPAFTPPWNRCDLRTLDALKTLGFQAVSRFRESKPPPPAGLTEIPVHVDLHTRKETTPAQGWRRLWGELAAGLASGGCGIMLHHRCMNEAAFDFLERLLQGLANHRGVAVVHLKDLVAE